MTSRPSSSRLRAAKPKQQSLRNRTTSKRVSYREASSDSDDFDQPSSQEESEANPPLPSRPLRHKTSKVPSTSTSTKRKARSYGKRRLDDTKKVKTGHVVEFHKQKEQENTGIQMTGKVMPWDTLPYQILASIFEYASWPLVADSITPLPSISWLLRAALCCKAFAEPALSALYYSPPLTPPTRAKALINHLATTHERQHINYAAKVKYIEVEAWSALQHKYAGQDPIDLGALVMLTPQLRGICINRFADNSKYRNGPHARTATAARPVHHRSLFAALSEKKIRLQDWTWNQSLAKQSDRLANIKEIHLTPPFQGVQTLSLVNYEEGPLEKGRRREDILVETLSMLPSLTGLIFRMSTIVNKRLTPLLPDSLQSLEIVECSSLKSSDLHKFLTARGGNLRRLMLNHNHSLKLSFLVELSRNCPQLELLRMDLRYFNTFFTVRDVEPKYDLLLQEGEVPSWPSSLQHLELFHLRKWSVNTAELFFSSLTDASQSLSQLRQLRIKASLYESGWRDRVGLRDKWTQRLRHVFLRKSTPPSPHLKTLASFKEYKRRQGKHHNGNLPIDSSLNFQGTGTTKPSPPKRKSNAQLSHVEIPQKAPDADETDSDAPLSNLRRSTRAKPQKDDMCALSESSPNASTPQRRRRRRRKGSDDSSSEDSAIDDDGIEPSISHSLPEDVEVPGKMVQGMCDVVDVLIDNLRPTEEQFHENDFLDEEVSGDEDWNGDDDERGQGYAW